MRAGSSQAGDRCNVSETILLQDWLTEQHIEDVEAIVPDMAGAARGKVMPAAKFGKGDMKMPEAVFAQTISGDYVSDPDNVEDRDMWLVPDPKRCVPCRGRPTRRLRFSSTAITATVLRLPSRRATYCATCCQCTRRKAGFRWWRPRSSSTC